MLESAIQSKIQKHLENQGFFVTKITTSNRPGIPDILATKGAFCLWVEVKKPGGKVSALQEYIHKQLRKNGGIVIVPFGYDDFLEKYNEQINKLRKIPRKEKED